MTADLIRLQSVNPPGDVNACALFIADWLRKNGIQAEIARFAHADNVVAKFGNESGPKVLWNGHFDVVPAGELSLWNSGPFEAVEKDGFLYGRGAADMKSGVAAMMLGLKRIKEAGLPMKGQIVFQGIGDEETGSTNGTLALLNAFGAKFDAAFVPEPTDFCVESAQRGLRWLEIRIRGKAAHAGRPHVGRNAIEHAAKIIAALKSIKYDVRNDFFEEGLREPSLSVNMIHGGIKENIIAEACVLRIDRRMLPGETQETVSAQVRKAVDSAAEEGFTDETEIVGKGWNPYMLDQNERILREVKASYKTVTGKEPVLRGKGGCTDASHIYDAGIPVVILGPGAANESHTANEKVEIARIARVCEIMIDATLNFING